MGITGNKTHNRKITGNIYDSRRMLYKLASQPYSLKIILQQWNAVSYASQQWNSWQDTTDIYEMCAHLRVRKIFEAQDRQKPIL
jgi:hypothetical protein